MSLDTLDLTIESTDSPSDSFLLKLVFGPLFTIEVDLVDLSSAAVLPLKIRRDPYSLITRISSVSLPSEAFCLAAAYISDNMQLGSAKRRAYKPLCLHGSVLAITHHLSLCFMFDTPKKISKKPRSNAV